VPFEIVSNYSRTGEERLFVFGQLRQKDFVASPKIFLLLSNRKKLILGLEPPLWKFSLPDGPDCRIGPSSYLSENPLWRPQGLGLCPVLKVVENLPQPFWETLYERAFLLLSNFQQRQPQNRLLSRLGNYSWSKRQPSIASKNFRAKVFSSSETFSPKLPFTTSFEKSRRHFPSFQ